MLAPRIRFVLSLLAVIILMPTSGVWGEDVQLEFEALREAAEQGVVEAQFKLGIAYYVNGQVRGGLGAHTTYCMARPEGKI